MTSKTNPPRRERTAVELWNHAVREAHAGDDGSDASDVLEASDEEIERRLLAAGLDLAAEDAAAAATYPAMVARLEAERRRPAADEGDAPGSDVAWVAPTELRPLPRAPRSRAVWLAYAIAAAAAIGGAAYVAGHRDRNPPPPEEPKHEEPVVHPVDTAKVPPPAPAPTERPGPDKPDKGSAR